MVFCFDGNMVKWLNDNLLRSLVLKRKPACLLCGSNFFCTFVQDSTVLL